MTKRRLRLSIESLDDRIVPASAADLTGLAQQTVGTAMLLQAWSRDPMILASPALRPAVVSYFTGVYQQATTTLSLIGQFPGTLPAAEQQVVSSLAQIQVNVAQSVAARLGFTVVAATPAPAPAPAPTPGAASPTRSTLAASPASVAVGQTSTVTLQAKDASGTNLTTGGAVVTFALGTGTAVGTIGQVTDNHNGTYTATFTATTVGSNTITATLNGTAVTATAPITVTAATTGTPSAAQSTVAAAPTSVPVGHTSTVTLTAKDAAGTALTAGGATVTFALGAGTTIGTFGNVTDNNNGTYTATFTAGTAGSNTVTATINGQAVTTALPTITVTSGTGTGTADPAQSTVAAAPTSVPVGQTSTVTLQAKDAGGANLTAGGATVVFGLGAGGPTTGAFGTVTDNQDGTYTATFTASAAGTNTVTATINGQAVTSTLPSITVTAGSGTPDLAQSTVAAAPSSVPVGQTSTITLTAKDAGGNALTTGGAAVAFALGAGTTIGNIGPVTDNQDGTYTATFTATTAGSNTIKATIGGQPVTSAAPTVTVTGGTATADLAHSGVALAPTSILSGGSSVVTLTARDSAGTQLTTGGSTVTFALGGGSAAGTFDTVVDNGDGTYTANFTASGAGTNTIIGSIGGAPLTSAAPTITVT